MHKVSSTKYDYYIDLVGDGNYGKAYTDWGCWDGMIGELLSDKDCRKNIIRKVQNEHVWHIYSGTLEQ